MAVRVTGKKTGARYLRHRSRVIGRRATSVQVVVPARDADLVRAAASALRSGGEAAQRVRDALGPADRPRPCKTGAELVAFLRASPFYGEDMDFERDRGTGRVALARRWTPR